MRMQTASARVGMLQTLKNVFYKEGSALVFQSYRRISCLVQRSLCIPSTTGDVLDRAVRRLRRIERALR